MPVNKHHGLRDMTFEIRLTRIANVTLRYGFFKQAPGFPEPGSSLDSEPVSTFRKIPTSSE